MRKNSPLRVMGQDTMREYLQTDLQMDNVLKSTKTSCTRGCTACCNQLVSMTLQEVSAIVATYPDVLLSKRRELEQQADVLEELTKEAFGASAMEISGDEAAESFRVKNNQVADAWWAKQLPCVFLRGKTCTVYEARPMACRGYYVQSDPQDCSLSYDSDGVPVKQNVTVVDFSAMTALRWRLMRKINNELSIMYLQSALLSAIKLMR